VIPTSTLVANELEAAGLRFAYLPYRWPRARIRIGRGRDNRAPTQAAAWQGRPPSPPPTGENRLQSGARPGRHTTGSAQATRDPYLRTCSLRPSDAVTKTLAKACLRRHGARTIAAASTWRAFHRLGLLLRASARDCCSISQHLQLAGTSLEVDVIDHNGEAVPTKAAKGLLLHAPGDHSPSRSLLRAAGGVRPNIARQRRRRASSASDRR
jgi:hypothetical protein